MASFAPEKGDDDRWPIDDRSKLLTRVASKFGLELPADKLASEDIGVVLFVSQHTYTTPSKMKISLSASAIAIAASFHSIAAAQELLRGGLTNFQANQADAFKHALGVNEAAMNNVSLNSERAQFVQSLSQLILSY